MSTASGLVRASRALLAAAKSAAASAPKAPAVAAPQSKKAAPKSANKKKPPTRPSGIMLAKPISPSLQAFVGMPEISRGGALKKIWEHIKLKNLQNPANKREIFCDATLKNLFAGQEKVGFWEISKLLSPHFVKNNCDLVKKLLANAYLTFVF